MGGFHAPHTLVYHWWDSSKFGKLKAEGWPSYSLESADDNTTLVRHHAKMHTYRLYRLAKPILRRIAVKERTTTVDALKASRSKRLDSGARRASLPAVPPRLIRNDASRAEQ